ncbi:MAG: type 4a pilus biogenesis protein PilO [Candidatus Omnitrophica bacterium]|jgi:Tfp pilus assembly protein PilO|nr:type 4a pilus biogenesis protein PilO [Candidatus Omnitrophota bacterium]
MRKLKLDKNIIVAIVLVIVSIGEIILLVLGAGIVFNINKKISKIRQDLATIEKEWPNKDRYVSKSETLTKEIDDMREKFILPQQDSALFSYISTESKNFSVQIKVIKPQALQDYAASKIGKFKCLPITISAIGSFHNFAQFMDFLQTGKYFFDVLEMQILSDSPYHSIEMVICGLIKEN